MNADTQVQRDEYRFSLEDAGVPEVYAFMAAKNLAVRLSGGTQARSQDSAWELIIYGFLWSATTEGSDFWRSIYENCKALK